MSNGIRMALLAAYFIILPYLSRIGGGLDWVAQYFAPPDKLVFGLLFFGAFSAIPGIVLAALLTGRKRNSAMPMVVALLVMTGLTIFFHYDYDLASDAQAAIWLIIAPFYVAAGGLIAFFAFAGGQWLWQRVAGKQAGGDE